MNLNRDHEQLACAIDAFASAKVEQALIDFGEERQGLLNEIAKLKLDKAVLQDQLLGKVAKPVSARLIVVFDEAGREIGRGRLRAPESQEKVDHIASELSQLRSTFDFEPAQTEQRLVIASQEVVIDPGIGLRPVGVKPILQVNGVTEQFALVWEAYRATGETFEHVNPQRAVNGVTK
jgi:hypothetical protein